MKNPLIRIEPDRPMRKNEKAGHVIFTILFALLIAANTLLLSGLIEKSWRRLPALLCALCLLVTLWRVWVGVRDILRTDYLLDYNIELIEDCLEKGERDIAVPRPYAQTKYSAWEGLGYLETEDPGSWYNVYMARYFGADSLIGY